MSPDIHYHRPVVIFDLDDTLICERDYCRGGFKAIEIKLQQLSPDGRFAGIASELDNLLSRRLPYIEALRQRLAPDYTDRLESLLDCYGTHTEPPTPVNQEVLTTLDAISAQNIVMGIITDGRGRTQRAKVESAGLTRYFHPALILISEETGCDKTYPDNFIEIVRTFPEASQFIYIGDNPAKDFKMPRMLGWKTIQVPYNADNVHPPATENHEIMPADIIVDTFAQILKHVL